MTRTRGSFTPVRRRDRVDPGPPVGPDGVATWPPAGRGPARVYKGPRVPKGASLCAACYPAKRAGQEIPLANGVSVVLCPVHRDPAFIGSRSGRDFLASMTELLRSFGINGRRFHDAIARVARDAATRTTRPPRVRPGSYAWPRARARAEAVWSAGGTYDHGVRAALSLLESLPDGVRRPSAQTLRRWWRECRWLLGDGHPRHPLTGPIMPPKPTLGRLLLREQKAADEAGSSRSSHVEQAGRGPPSETP